MRLLFLTTNLGKVAEARIFFQRYGISVDQLEFDAVEPQASELEVVAMSKIEQAAAFLQDSEDMILVEDAGLFVDSLDGFPGVYSSYALETIGNHGILKLIGHLKSEDLVIDSNLRRAEFRAVAALYKDGELSLIHI